MAGERPVAHSGVGDKPGSSVTTRGFGVFRSLKSRPTTAAPALGNAAVVGATYFGAAIVPLWPYFFLPAQPRARAQPDGVQMLRQARDLLIDLDDRGQRPRLLIHDRDSKFSRVVVESRSPLGGLIHEYEAAAA